MIATTFWYVIKWTNLRICWLLVGLINPRETLQYYMIVGRRISSKIVRKPDEKMYRPQKQLENRKITIHERQEASMTHRTFSQKVKKRWRFGTDPDRNRVTWETPAVNRFPAIKSHLGVHASSRPGANAGMKQTRWLNTTFISQGSRSWDKLAVET